MSGPSLLTPAAAAPREAARRRRSRVRGRDVTQDVGCDARMRKHVTKDSPSSIQASARAHSLRARPSRARALCAACAPLSCTCREACAPLSWLAKRWEGYVDGLRPRLRPCRRAMPPRLTPNRLSAASAAASGRAQTAARTKGRRPHMAPMRARTGDMLRNRGRSRGRRAIAVSRPEAQGRAEQLSRSVGCRGRAPPPPHTAPSAPGRPCTPAVPRRLLPPPRPFASPASQRASANARVCTHTVGARQN